MTALRARVGAARAAWPLPWLAPFVAPLVLSCSTAGSAWMGEPSTAKDESEWSGKPPEAPGAGPSLSGSRFQTRVIGGEDDQNALVTTSRPGGGGTASSAGTIRGRILGTFRNTYYDFPTQADFSGDEVPLRDARCGTIASVPRAFNDAVCVQGSGILTSGRTVSFARRDCDCAEMCPKTGQKICFESLDPMKFPWGRGALGTAITPLVTVAVDDTIIPMGTPVYIPELSGLPLDAARSSVHDGCFIAQDRGLRVKGQHVDVFTGYSAMTALWNRLVPSNHGVTVVVDDPHCARAETPPPAEGDGEAYPTSTPTSDRPRRKPRRTDKPL